MKISTVNVIEMEGLDIASVESFSEDEEGNREAKASFKKKAMNKGATKDETESFLEDSYYESGHYQLFLAHSV